MDLKFAMMCEIKITGEVFTKNYAQSSVRTALLNQVGAILSSG